MKKGSLTLQIVEAALKKPLPGLAGQKRMAPVPRPFEKPPADHLPHQGGVLMLIYPFSPGGDLYVVLTRRTDGLPAHAGQISFPGGGSEPGDESISFTALREACEEVGVCSDDIRILGPLSPLYVPPSDFCIHPFVAYLPYRPIFRPQPAEVANILEVPLDLFVDEANVVVEDWLMAGQTLRVPYFNVQGYKVWGATAIVLGEFVTMVEDFSQ